MARAKKWSSDDWRADAVAALAEFIGTFTFLLLGLGGIQAARTASVISGMSGESMQVTVPSVEFLLMAATSMSMALIFSIWIFFRVTGAAFNPNIALCLCVLGVISPVRFVMYSVAHLLGAIAASAVLVGILPGPLLVNCAPSNGIGTAQALFFEMFLTAALCLTVCMVAVAKNKTTPLAPVAIGLALFSTQLAGINFTGAAVNTARAFGPAVATRSFEKTHWIYWVGPGLGALVAAGLYKIFILIHFWELNPGADDTKEESHESKPRASDGNPV